MRKLLMAATVMITTFSSYAGPDVPEIIPEPVQTVFNGAGVYRLMRDAIVSVSDSSLTFEAGYLADYTDRYLGIPLETTVNYTDKPAISLVNLNNGAVSGGYRLTVGQDSGVLIEGNDAAGVFYGIQTLIQLLPTRAGVLPLLPEVAISDYPRFPYRGMHLDVVRHFFPVEFIKRYIDYLALHKLNYFHWHLTDDQAWRLDLECYPELTRCGSEREGEIFGLYPGEYRELPYGGCYTRRQVDEVVLYAAERHITVVPEIDIPGHCMAVLTAFPCFGTTPDEPKKCALTWGIFNKFNNVLAPKPEVFDFLKNVFSEVCDIFPGQYIHVGGDECAKKWWQESAETQTFMREHGLKDEKALQSYFIHYVQNIVEGKGKTLVGWDEVLQGGISGDCVIMNWRQPAIGRTSLRTGHKTIVTCSQWSYFNIKESRLDPVVGAKGKSPLSVQKVYEFSIEPDSITEKERPLLLGAQACLWTEYIPTVWKAEQFVFPRMAAMAENVWSPADKKNWENFARKVERQVERYELWGARYSDAFFRMNDIKRYR